MHELRFGGFDKDNLKELVGIVAGLQKGGLKKFKVFPRGIILADSLHVTGTIDAGDTARFLGEILLNTPRLGGIVVFPFGTPLPEIFKVNINIGSPVENAL